MFWFADSFCLLQAGVSSSQNSEFQAAASSADVIASGRQRGIGILGVSAAAVIASLLRSWWHHWYYSIFAHYVRSTYVR